MNHRSRRLALIWLALLVTGVALAETSSAEYVLSQALLTPTVGHWLGFDAFGRDLLGTLLRGAGLSAGFSLVVVLASAILGIAVGGALALMPAGSRFAGLRALDTLVAFPSLLLALGIAVIRGPGWDTLIASLLVGILPGFVRLMYVRSAELLHEEYVLAARSLGASLPRILTKHLGPPLLSLCRIKLPSLFAQALLAEATLSFLGVGAPIGRDSWGALLSQGKDYLLEAPHIAFGTGLPLVFTILALQLVSESRPALRTSQSRL